MSKKQGSKKDGKDSNKRQTIKNNKNISQQSEQLRKAKEKEMLDAINFENIQKYLKNIELTNKKQDIINKFGIESIQKVVQSLNQGTLQIPDDPSPFPKKEVLPPKLTYQEQKEIEVKAKRENIVKKIQYFYDQIRGQNSKSSKKQNEALIQFKEILTKEQHERRTRQIQQQKEERQKRLQQLHQQQERRQKQEEQKLKSQKQAQQLKAKQQKRAKISQNIAKRKQMHEKFLQNDAKFEKQRLTLIKKPKLFQQMEQSYKSQVLLPFLEQKKLRLKQLRDFKKQYEIDAIKQHEKNYIEKSQQRSRSKKSEPEWKYDPPAKTQRLAKMLEQQQIELQNQLQARKRRIQDMQSRQQLFKIDLKQKYKPKIDEIKRKQIQSRLSLQKRENITAVQQRQIGKTYLQMAKKLNRSQSLKQNTIKSAITLNPSIKSQKKSQFKLKNHSQQFYEDIRRKKIEDVINSEETSVGQKYLMLKIQTDKIGQKIKQKQSLIKVKNDGQAKQEATELLLSSIKAKISLVSLLKQK